MTKIATIPAMSHTHHFLYHGFFGEVVSDVGVPVTIFPIVEYSLA
jgi:hypothetical protein